MSRKRTGPLQTSVIDALQQTVTEMLATPPPTLPTVAGVISDMRNEITELVAKGYTLEQIAERFTAVGVPVTPAALRRYRKGRRSRSKRSSTVPQSAEKSREK